MFFDGDLQAGIALALQESKIVACFIRSDDEQSTLWEAEYLKDDQVARALALKTVTLRIDNGSPEAGFLSAYYPLPVVPAFILIQNGQLVLDLRSGETQDTFKAAVLKTLAGFFSQNALETASTSTPEDSIHRSGAPNHTTPERPNSQPQPSVPLRTTASTESSSAAAPRTEIAPTSDSLHDQPSQTVQNLLAYRRRKLEQDKKNKEAQEKADRKAKADARKESMTVEPNSGKAKQASYAQQQRKRQHEAKLERERILRQIEHDKVERKEKEELRKALAKAEAEGHDGAGGLVNQQLSKEMDRMPRSMTASKCAIQVRMFDGSTIRSKFEPEQTLRTGVRAWVDEHRSDGDFPYTFKQILAPLPNRSLSISDEEGSLQSLSLAPSATLVMVPVQGFTAAYSANQGLLSKGVSAGYNVVSGGAGLVTGALGTFLGYGQPAVPQGGNATSESTAEVNPDSANRGATSGINIRTLQDERDKRDDHQFYNGNQLNFEPRRNSDTLEE